MADRQLLIVEDHADLRQSLTASAMQVLRSADACAAGSLGEARAWLDRHRRTDAELIALVDLDLPDGRGETLIAELADDPSATVIVTTIFEDDENVMRALAAGAQGYLLKGEQIAGIEARLRGLDAGEVAISPQIARRLLRSLRAPAKPETLAALTERETDVLRCIGRGLTAPEAANALHIMPHTVSSHLKNIYRKLNIASRAEAAIEASRRGLL